MFQLESKQAATCTNANPRREFHGKDLVRAIDLAFAITGENTLLDLIEPGLREHHFHSAAADAGQIDLATVEAAGLPLANLRFPKLPTENIRYDSKTRGYRWIWDWGTEDQHVDFTDAVVHGINYDVQEGGSVAIRFTLTFNGEELQDNDLYGELCALPTMGDVFIQLFAPPELIAVKKGYRAGKNDTPQPPPKDPAQAQLPGSDDGDGHVGDAGLFQGDDDDDVLPAGSPESALAGTEKLH
jgi:hypothetical protein